MARRLLETCGVDNEDYEGEIIQICIRKLGSSARPDTVINKSASATLGFASSPLLMVGSRPAGYHLHVAFGFVYDDEYS